MKYLVLGLLLVSLSVFAGGGVAFSFADLGLQTPSWLEYVITYWDIITNLVGTFALIAAAVPNPKVRRFAIVLRKLVDYLGANFFNAKNKDQ